LTAEADAKLHGIMKDIHDACVEYGSDGKGNVDYVKGATLLVS
jgi:glutamate dehydrogenase (NADP+)